MPSVVMIPHPVDTSNHRFSGGGVKNNQVIAIARWDVAFKGWPLLKRIAQRFLRIHGDWKLIVAGVGAEKEGAALAAEFEGRFEMLGFLEHARLSDHLRASKIYLLTSYVESFNIAGAEALCCGCSVVGPGQIPSSAFFAGMASGTPSHRRNADELLDALSAEVGEWESGSRDPVAIAEHWKERVSAESVARRFAELFQPAVSGMGIPAQPQKSAGQE